MKIIPIDYLFPYIGGKKALRPWIVPMIPGDISTYVEPFFGGGAIYFAREKWAPCEIINDLNDEIISLYRVVKEHGEEFAREFNFVFSSRTFFNRIRNITPPQENHQYFQAFRTLYLLNFCFGARLVNPSYAPNNLSSVESIQARIIAISKRLQKTNIECLDYSVLLERYNKPDTFFYLDPPYFEHYYKAGSFDHERLAGLLKESRARWILSYNSCPEICELYKDFKQKTFSRRCSLNNKQARDFGELLVWNFEEGIQGTLF